MAGKLLKLEKYFYGKLLSDSLVSEANPIKWVEDYYENGKVKFRGGYKNGLPIGIQKEYPPDGAVIIAKEYDENGVFIGDGTVDENDKKQGIWKYYYESGEVKSKGAFKDNLKTGEWIFYYEDGKIEQRGKYNNDKPTGLWTWFYTNGNKWREENLVKGIEEGTITEYNKEGIEILKGEYVDGERNGIWNFNNGDNKEEGTYQDGLQNGIWKGWFSNGKINYQVNYVQGVPDGKYKLYYENGNMREEGIYSMGSKEKNWNKYDFEGNLYLTITYKNDKEFKLNGVKIKLPKGSTEK
jgi:antitoxin component YwqK of YwqJK toxin-antitoxin module